METLKVFLVAKAKEQCELPRFHVVSGFFKHLMADALLLIVASRRETLLVHRLNYEYRDATGQNHKYDQLVINKAAETDEVGRRSRRESHIGEIFWVARSRKGSFFWMKPQVFFRSSVAAGRRGKPHKLFRAKAQRMC